MNTFYVQHRVVARLWAAVTMFAVLLSAFVAPFSVAFAQGPAPVDPAAIVDSVPTGDADSSSDQDELGNPNEEQFTFARVANGGDKIIICHANESNEQANNPFTKNTVDESSLNGHGEHPDDIIPVTTAFPAGQNLEKTYLAYGGKTGAEILALDCPKPPKPKKEVTIVATKIVCPNEAMLPNDGFSSIDANTAPTFLAANPSCSLAPDWKFQYAIGGVSNQNAPDNDGELAAPWKTSAKTGANGQTIIKISEDELDNATLVSVREVWNEDYIPFTGNGGGDVSAELYCAKDAANFDNLDWVGQNETLALDKTYHCVAFNVPKPPKPVACELTIKSDATDLVVEKNDYAKLLTTIHNNWVAAIPSSVAKWIWGVNPVKLPTTVDETQTFKKSFTWNGLTIDSAVLTLASDNSHAITLGSFVGGDSGEFNYGATKNYNVASAIATGTNTLTVAVKNFALASSNASSNPAGLLYELKIKGTGTTKDCGVVVPLEPEKPKVAEVTMCKVDGNQNALSGWNLMLLGDKVHTKAISATNGTGETVALDTGA